MVGGRALSSESCFLVSRSRATGTPLFAPPFFQPVVDDRAACVVKTKRIRLPVSSHQEELIFFFLSVSLRLFLKENSDSSLGEYQGSFLFASLQLTALIVISPVVFSLSPSPPPVFAHFSPCAAVSVPPPSSPRVLYAAAVATTSTMWVISRPFLAAAVRTAVLCQKKQTAAGYMASAGKVGNEEKWAQAAMEYIHEKNHVNDSRKRQQDVDRERSIANAYDRYSAVSEAKFDERLSRLIARMSEALEEMQKLGLDEALEEAVLLNSEQPPGLYRRPSLTPPLVGYEPGFGLDVPQLRGQQAEYPPVRRPTDWIEFGEGSADDFPFVDAHRIEDLAAKHEAQLEEQHGVLREAAPLTGVEGEGWEAYVALHRKALARQRLIIDLHNDPELRDRYDADEAFRVAEWERRGMNTLGIEAPLERDVELHYAQVPAYVAFRSQ